MKYILLKCFLVLVLVN